MEEPTDRELAVDPELGVILTRLHHALGAPPAPPLLAAQLADVERLVGSVVPDVVLALLQAEGRSVGALVREHELLQSLASSHDPPVPSRLRRLIPFDHWGEHPMYFVGFAPTRARDATALEVRETKAWVSVPEFGIVDVRSHVRERYAGIHREGEPLSIDLDAPLRDGERAPGVRVLAPRAPAERRVEHPKLGPGRVVREVDGAWVVAFDSGETKTIVPRFLRLL